jgi:hypothetical protein
MTKGNISFHLCLQKQQNYAAGERSMMHARLFYRMSINGQAPIELFTDIAQPYDSDYEASEIEVGPPVTHKGELIPYSGPYNHLIYKGPFNHEAFSEKAEEYYRSCIGSSGSGIKIGGSSSNIIMSENRFHKNLSFEMSLGESGHGPW